MQDLYNKVKKYLGRDFTIEEVHLQDDRIGGVVNEYIEFWSPSVEKPKPTEEELNAL